jgi:acetyltransferase-like isoleucine patch superfamily enzyme
MAGHAGTGFDLSRLKRCGKDVRISPNAVIRNPDLVEVGDHVAIDDFTLITTAMVLGDWVHVASHVSVIGGREARCVMGDFTGLSAGCRLVCATDDYLGGGILNPFVPAEERGPVTCAPIVLEKHAVLGTGCVVHPGVTIGEGTVVGSLSLVTRSLEPWQICRGIPARPVRPRPRDVILEREARLRADTRS